MSFYLSNNKKRKNVMKKTPRDKSGQLSLPCSQRRRNPEEIKASGTQSEPAWRNPAITVSLFPKPSGVRFK